MNPLLTLRGAYSFQAPLRSAVKWGGGGGGEIERGVSFERRESIKFGKDDGINCQEREQKMEKFRNIKLELIRRSKTSGT